MSALVDALGVQAANRLAGIIGGRTIKVPTLLDEANARAGRARLVRLVGADLAGDLITAFAGTRVYIPRGPSPHNSRVRPVSGRRVAILTGKGMSAQAIAERLGCTVRTVYLKRAQLAQRSTAGRDRSGSLPTGPKV